MQRNAKRERATCTAWDSEDSSVAIGFVLPYKKLSPAQHEELALIMREGGEVLKAAHIKVRAAKRKAAHNSKLSYCRREFRIELFKQVGAAPRPVAICGVLITKEEVTKIYAIRAREVQILEGYSNLIRRIIFSRISTGDTYILIDDCCEEGAMAIIDAAYHYTKNDTAFVTFVYWAIFRRIHRALNRAKQNFPWSQKMRELYQRYQQAKSDINRPANFEDVVQFMGLNDEDRDTLRAALVQIISESDSGDSDDETPHAGNNYLDTLVAVESPTLEADEISIIGAAKLDEWEQAVLEAYLSGHRGWRTEVAKRFGKSKPAVPICLQRVVNKIQMAFDLGGKGDNPALRRLLNTYNGKEEVA